MLAFHNQIICVYFVLVREVFLDVKFLHLALSMKHLYYFQFERLEYLLKKLNAFHARAIFYVQFILVHIVFSSIRHECLAYQSNYIWISILKTRVPLKELACFFFLSKANFINSTYSSPHNILIRYI